MSKHMEQYDWCQPHLAWLGYENGVEPNKNSVWPEFSHLPEVCELDRFILENNIDVSKPAQILTNRILDEKIDLASNAVVAEQRKRRQE